MGAVDSASTTHQNPGVGSHTWLVSSLGDPEWGRLCSLCTPGGDGPSSFGWGGERGFLGKLYSVFPSFVAAFFTQGPLGCPCQCLEAEPRPPQCPLLSFLRAAGRVWESAAGCSVLGTPRFAFFCAEGRGNKGDT